MTRVVEKHIIHCSDTPDDRDVQISQIKAWHLDRGWSDIGYHYVIHRDGSLHHGRDFNTTGAHCKGYNTGSVGTCLIGREKFTKKQFNTLYILHQTLKHIFPNLEVFGHRDFNSDKTCPGFDVGEFFKCWDQSLKQD